MSHYRSRVMTLFSQRGVDWIIRIHTQLRFVTAFLLLGISESKLNAQNHEIK